MTDDPSAEELPEVTKARIRALAFGWTEPSSGFERHFLRVVERTAAPLTPEEHRWHAYWRQAALHLCDPQAHKPFAPSAGVVREPIARAGAKWSTEEIDFLLHEALHLRNRPANTSTEFRVAA